MNDVQVMAIGQVLPVYTGLTQPGPEAEAESECEAHCHYCSGPETD